MEEPALGRLSVFNGTASLGSTGIVAGTLRSQRSSGSSRCCQVWPGGPWATTSPLGLPGLRLETSLSRRRCGFPAGTSGFQAQALRVGPSLAVAAG